MRWRGYGLGTKFAYCIRFRTSIECRFQFLRASHRMRRIVRMRSLSAFHLFLTHAKRVELSRRLDNLRFLNVVPIVNVISSYLVTLVQPLCFGQFHKFGSCKNQFLCPSKTGNFLIFYSMYWTDFILSILVCLPLLSIFHSSLLA